MEQKYISPQTKIATSVYFRGGTATTLEISKDTGMSYNDIQGNGRHLISRSILKKQTIRRKNGTYDFCIWTIRPQKLEKVKQMIRDAYGDEIFQR